MEGEAGSSLGFELHHFIKQAKIYGPGISATMFNRHILVMDRKM